MTRPLIITDCDEVLLHMVVPFRHWLDETHDVHFDMHDRSFAEALRHKDSGERHHQQRIAQLAALGLDFPVHWNQGGKGRPLADIVADRQPSIALFIDDLAEHHHSVATHAPDVWRLHMVGEAEIAAGVPAAPYAHARIDDWVAAEAWIMQRLAQGPAPKDIVTTGAMS